MANFMTEKQRWFRYDIPATATTPSREGSFDMLEVFWTEGTALRAGGPKNWVLRLRSAPTVPLILDDTSFQKFARALDDYWIAREKL
jgi:hypothetical protein